MKLTKIDKNGKEYYYGNITKEEAEAIIPKGYKFNGLFYEKKDTQTIYIVE